MLNLDSVDHIVLTVSNIKKTRDFYSKLFGTEFKMDDKNSFHIDAGNTLVFFGHPSGILPENDRFNENRIGLDHFAFRISERKELGKVLVNLKKMSVQTEGIEIDKYGNKEYVCFRDPDNIQVEFYLRK